MTTRSFMLICHAVHGSSNDSIPHTDVGQLVMQHRLVCSLQHSHSWRGDWGRYGVGRCASTAAALPAY